MPLLKGNWKRMRAQTTLHSRAIPTRNRAYWFPLGFRLWGKEHFLNIWSSALNNTQGSFLLSCFQSGFNARKLD